MPFVYPSKLLSQVKAHLKYGGVIAYPTEYCYGLGCDPFNYKAINRLIKIKSRLKTKGIIVIAASQAQLKSLVDNYKILSDPELDKYWPGFYSLLLPANKKLPRNLIGKHTKIALRVTKHSGVIQLCKALKSPLLSSSANKSGFRAITNYRECLKQLSRQVMVLPGVTRFAKHASRLIDWETKNILR